MCKDQARACLQPFPRTRAIWPVCHDTSRHRHAHVQGHQLATAEVSEGLRALALSPCGRLIVAAGERVPLPHEGASAQHRAAPVPTLFWLHSLKVRERAPCVACRPLRMQGSSGCDSASLLAFRVVLCCRCGASTRRQCLPTKPLQLSYKMCRWYAKLHGCCVHMCR